MMPRIVTLATTFALLLPAALANSYALRTVEPGDTLGSIANRYGVPVEMIVDYNRLDSTLIHPGQVLRVPFVEATGGPASAAPELPPGFERHLLASGETLSEIAGANGLTIEALVGANPDLSSLDRLPVGTELLIPPGPGLLVTISGPEDLQQLIAEHGVDPIEVVRLNGLAGPGDLQPGRQVFLPGVRPETALDRLAKVREMENRYVWPVHGRITSYFGRRNLGMGTAGFHRGVDVAAPWGTPVIAARSGTVTYAGWSSQGYGYLVKIRHQGGAETWYAHHSKVLVGVGQYVSQGEIIGRVGSTGLSTGPHLHFELHERGRAINPLNELN